MADGGTIFLDEVGELPIATQAKLLRILESGDFIKVGSSNVQKTDVRIVAATNLNLPEAVKQGKFREDLYYRLNTVPIAIPALRDRKDDIQLLFRKFSRDFSEKYNVPSIKLTDDAIHILTKYRWPGNIRQLKNITEQISIIEKERVINAAILENYLPNNSNSNLPALYEGIDEQTFKSEREILYKILFDMKSDMNDLKKLVYGIVDKAPENITFAEDKLSKINDLFNNNVSVDVDKRRTESYNIQNDSAQIQDTEEIIEESLSLEAKEIEMIKKALDKYAGKRKKAASELGISERTLYRKIKEYNIER